MNIPSCVSSYPYMTVCGYVCISGCMGGAVEMSDSGRYYTAKTVQQALNHYARKYKQYCTEYARKSV